MRRKLVIALLGLWVIAGYERRNRAPSSLASHRRARTAAAIASMLAGGRSRHAATEMVPTAAPAAARCACSPARRHRPPSRHRRGAVKTLSLGACRPWPGDPRQSRRRRQPHRANKVLPTSKRVLVEHASDGQEQPAQAGIIKLRRSLLDVMMPGIDWAGGVSSDSSAWRSGADHHADGAWGRSRSRVVGLELGAADDYLAKPV